MFYEEIRIKQDISHTSLCPLRILYKSKFVITASFGTNAVVVTKVHCIMFILKAMKMTITIHLPLISPSINPPLKVIRSLAAMPPKQRF